MLIERKFFALEQHFDTKKKQNLTRAVPPTAAGVKAGDTILMRVSIKSPIALPYIMVDAALPSSAEVVSKRAQDSEMPGKFNVAPVSFAGMYTKAVRGYSAADQIVVRK